MFRFSSRCSLQVTTYHEDRNQAVLATKASPIETFHCNPHVLLSCCYQIFDEQAALHRKKYIDHDCRTPLKIRSSIGGLQKESECGRCWTTSEMFINKLHLQQFYLFAINTTKVLT